MFPSLLLLLSLLSPSGAPPGQTLDWTEHPLIAHALGGVEGADRTNSREALETNYALGFRVFETDLMLTTDEHLVARHDWEKKLFVEFGQVGFTGALKDWNPLSLEDFKRLPILNRYEGLEWKDLLEFMVQHPDVYYVLDTKFTDERTIKRQFKLLTEEAERIDPALLNRIVPQLYHQQMLGTVDSIHRFSSYIYTLYQSKDTNGQVVEFLRRNPRVKAAAMPPSRAKKDFIDSLKKLGVRTYVHTINDYSTYLKLRQTGVSGVYTDFLSYAQVLKGLKGSWTAAPPLPPDSES
ncbi:glycerophosphodiester phosphodiesterase [Cohnella pontilimi]|uniref:Glycerophosphodiester phosphodiesterase n=1 Tax=Cohnella pontilimi TaxID=2564100 RepID=A0A4U0F8I2_9BACL|nr:phosphatidylinositol-specific phospholipase C/glycerophosphodiester phosphodiesterase family protein [Cohnella pontilimi]TJY40975.1 glycerophosphodiester phosphodiesterase [Cohnella pontilimi]